MDQQLDEKCPACGDPLGVSTVDHLGFRLRACPNCGLWSWADRNPADYDTVYGTAEYEEVQIVPMRTATDPQEFVRHPTYAPFFRNVPYKAGASLLDIGCGVGRFLVAARSIGWSTYGTDVSNKAVEIGRNDAGLDLSCDTLEQIHEAGGKFDAVTAFEVLEHVPQPIGLVEAAMLLLKEGGWFFCTVPNRESPTVLTTRRPDWLPPIHLQFFTTKALQSLLSRCGGRNVRTGLILAGSHRRDLVGRAKQVVKRLIRRGSYDPLGIWGMAQR